MRSTAETPKAIVVPPGLSRGSSELKGGGGMNNVGSAGTSSLSNEPRLMSVTDTSIDELSGFRPSWKSFTQNKQYV